ncbi:DNA cytosine methyltransferase [Oceanithermus sp.]
MNLRNLTVLVILLLVALFAGLNWPLFTAPSEINLLFTRVSAPLGLILLAVIALLSLLYFLFIAVIETGALIEIRRYARQVEQARKLADQAEASRFAELKRYLEQELNALAQGQSDLKAHVSLEAGEARKALSLEHDTLKSQHAEISGRVDQKTEQLKGELLARLESLERGLASDVERTGNTLAAYLGELEDRLLGRAGEGEAADEEA